MLAHGLVALADELDVNCVIFDERFWHSRNSRGSRQPYEAPQLGNEVLPQLNHTLMDALKGG